MNVKNIALNNVNDKTVPMLNIVIFLLISYYIWFNIILYISNMRNKLEICIICQL